MIMRTVVRLQLPPYLDHVADSAVSDSSYIRGRPEEDEALIRAANAKGISIVWYTFTGLLGACDILCVFIQDTVKRREVDEEDKVRLEVQEASGASTPFSSRYQSQNVSTATQIVMREL